MKIFTFRTSAYQEALKKTLLVMKLTALLIMIGFLQVSAAVHAQHLNLTAKNISLDKLFRQIEKQSDYHIFYDVDVLKDLPHVNVELNNASIKEVMAQCFKGKPLDFKIIDKNIVIKRTDAPHLMEVHDVQTIIFTGILVDEHNVPLPGATVKIKGALTGQTVTNQKGQFTITAVNPDDVLVFSFIGYQTLEIPVNKLQNPLHIVMKESVSDLDQVQVTAYGQTTKRLSTGSITTITAKEIEENPVPNVLQALQGRVAGLFIQQNSGVAGTPFSVEVRGTNSLSGILLGPNSAPQPLLVVDGVTYPSGKLPLLGNGSIPKGGVTQSVTGSNTLNYLDPQSIESIEVLKDADATSIYGSRGAYGVILITTKKGKGGNPIVTFNSYTGVTTRGVTQQFLTAQQYQDVRKEAFKNDGATPGATDYDVNGTWNPNQSTNWNDLYLKKAAVTSSNNVSYSGGSDLNSYRIGVNYNTQGNIQKTTGAFTNIGANVVLSSTTRNKKFNITSSNSYSSTTNTQPTFDITSLLRFPPAPNAPLLTNPDGSYNWKDYADNPLANYEQVYRNVTNNLTSGTQLQYKPVTGLLLNVGLNYNKISGKELQAFPTAYFNPSGVVNPSSTLSNFDLSTWSVEPNANYTHKAGKQGTFAVTAGLTVQQALSVNSSIAGSNFVSSALLFDPASAPTNGFLRAGYNQTQTNYLGYFGIVNYNWADKYIINLNGRYDGSSKFGGVNQFGFFGSAGAAWIISEEGWFKNNISFISFAKLRGSYGTTGGDKITDYSALSTYSVGNSYQGNIGLKPTLLANPYLQWEKDKKGNIELNLEFLKGRVNISASYFDTRASNQLISQGLSSVTGFGGIISNQDAVIHSYGYEIVLLTNNIAGKNFKWSTNLNFTIPKSILVSYPNLATSGFSNILQVGKPVTGIKVYPYAGVDPQTGVSQYINHNGVVTDNSLFNPVQLNRNVDNTQFIDLSPKYQGGITNTFRYKNITLDALITVVSRTGKSLLGSFNFPPGYFGGSPGVGYTTSVLKRWQNPGDVTNIPKFTQNALSAIAWFQSFQYSAGAYDNATYARLQNVSVAYTFPGKVINRAGINGLTVFLRGQNLLTVSKYGDLDPENLGSGVPPLRVFTAGITLTL
jgi:TonB-linked SusC/RagA family outer membrane protein